RQTGGRIRPSKLCAAQLQSPSSAFILQPQPDCLLTSLQASGTCHRIADLAVRIAGKWTCATGSSKGLNNNDSRKPKHLSSSATDRHLLQRPESCPRQARRAAEPDAEALLCGPPPGRRGAGRCAAAYSCRLQLLYAQPHPELARRQARRGQHSAGRTLQHRALEPARKSAGVALRSRLLLSGDGAEPDSGRTAAAAARGLLGAAAPLARLS